MAAITAANARELQAKSVQSRRARKEAALLARLQPTQTAQPTPQPIDSYLAERLLRVRKQLELLDRMFESETDPQRLDRLAAASHKLSQVERELAGRPLPGSYRPESPKSRGRIWGPAPTPVEPSCGPHTPTPSSQAQPTQAPIPQDPEPPQV